jgi:hypothetical protein
MTESSTFCTHAPYPPTKKEKNLTFIFTMEFAEKETLPEWSCWIQRSTDQRF